MLYQTHHPFLFQFQSFASIPLSVTTTTPLSRLHLLSSSIQEMECVEAALKSSFRKEMGLKSTTPQAFFEDFFTVNAQNGVSSDDFIVDEFLDLSNEDGFVGDEPEEDFDELRPNMETSDSVSLEQRQQEVDERFNSVQKTFLTSGEDFGSVPTSELPVPADDLADLEWFSNFVDDSFSEFSVPYPNQTLPEKPEWLKENRSSSQAATVLVEEACFKSPLPAKARSKRLRNGGRNWSLGSPSFSESSSSSTSESSISSPSNSSQLLVWPNPRFGPGKVSWGQPPVKKLKKKPSEGLAAGFGGGGSQPPRRCSHCGVQKTPQWRAGPLGAKTLCNACGVRFKSGRLLPEYRPACSPTFSSELHSNHHRKVVEMRRKKEVVVGQPEPDMASPAVPSF